MHLGELKMGEIATIIGISSECKGEIRQRLLDLGFIKGFKIMIQSISPLNDPIAYNIHNTLIALRKEDAKNILIEKLKL
ncbi:MAG: FeoA family protein [Flavobacteriaceae bacterium]|nr:FeoA family protein [Flavobacteriaceae bacterium]